MSVRVLAQVFEHSNATQGKRLTLIVLADAAGDDGICWENQDNIAAKARLSRFQVIRCINQLADDGEIELRKVQRGRRRINVYRVLVPGLADPDYERLPFKLAEPFSANDDVAFCNVVAGDDVANPSITTLQIRRSLARARDNGGLGSKGYVVQDQENRPEPLVEPLTEPAPALPRVRARDVVFDALAEATSTDPHLASQGRLLGKCCAELRGHPDYRRAVEQVGKAEADRLLASEVYARANAYTAHFGAEIALTAPALLKHWRRVTVPKESSIAAQLRQTAERLAAERGETL